MDTVLIFTTSIIFIKIFVVFVIITIIISLTAWYKLEWFGKRNLNWKNTPIRLHVGILMEHFLV